jgi:glycosyltransferase involved in cell wall biosynthesis
VRIGFVNTEIDMGGSSRAMQRTIAALNAAGHETVVITLAAKGDSAAPVIRVQDHTVGPIARRAGVAHFLYNGRYVDRNRTPLSDTLFWIPAVGLNVAEVVGRLDLDVLNVHWTSYFLSLMSLDQMMDLPTPVVLTLHDMAHFTGGCHYSAGCRGFETDCAPCPQLRFDPLRVPRDVRLSRAEVYRRRKPWAIAPSVWMTEAAQASGLFPDGRAVHVPNTLDLGVFSPRRRRPARGALGLDQNARVILFGAFDNREKRKGFDLLLEAMRRLLARPDFAGGPPVTVLGIGRHLPQLDLPGVSVVETGYIDDDDRLAEAYSACDVVALPSREDNLPNIMVEAMACGTPVAGFRLGGLVDLIDDGVTGALAEPFDADGLADAMARVILAGEAGDEMRLAARRAAQLKAGASTHVRGYLDVFARVRAERGYANPAGRDPMEARRWPEGVQYRPTQLQVFGGPPAEAAIRLRTMMK